MPSPCTTNHLYLRFALLSVLMGLLITFLPFTAQASEPVNWSTFMCCSQHAERGEYQQFNPGLGYQHALSSRWAYEFGVYWNSFRNITQYHAVRYTYLEYGSFRASISGTCAFGYKEPVCAPLPSFELDVTNNIAVEIIHIPKVVDALRIKWRVK